MEVAMLLQPSPELSQAGPSTAENASSGNKLKRRASSTFEDFEDNSSRKRPKETMEGVNETPDAVIIDGQALADELDQELQCGCCSALVYRPVVVSPCQHFFCGSCIVLWIRNGGTHCPACRGISSSVTPSRALQTIADILVRAAPSRARTANERIQADEIYKAGVVLRIPAPRQASPEPSIPLNNTNLVHPCPHCVPGNQYDWRCPQPIVDPELNPDGAWHTDEGSPPGHAYCGNCESILALRAPSTTKCDFCQVSFCGIGIPGRCLAAPIISQHLHGLADIGDLIQCGEVYEIFDGNTYEVDIMLDYLQTQGLNPRHIYREIVGMISRTPRQFAPMIESDLFIDVHGVTPGTDPDPSAPRNRICRMCATEVLLWGLREWWIKERKKGFLEDSILKRPDCLEGSQCIRQKEHVHAREFNHLIAGPESSLADEQAAEAEQQAQAGPSLPIPAAIPVAIPLLLPVDEANALDALENSLSDLHDLPDRDPELEQPKMDQLPVAPVARQSSIFKLLSPAMPSFGTSAPPTIPDREPFASTSQDAQAEVEAMI
ncbi:hypothetical protein BC835DRAFT_1332276 [Cytidiella melzeri]|nr:hypothetical protein BC835DRAFT_1332276 [Cytidiella melzeri]